MVVPDLVNRISGLTAPVDPDSSSDRFCAVPIDEYPRHHIGVDVNEQPSLLISVQHAARANPPIVLENLSVQFDVRCRITKPSGDAESGNFVVIRCRNVDDVLEVEFLRVCGLLVSSLGNSPSSDEVLVAVRQLVELFRAMSRSSPRTAQGLWAELLLISDARNPVTLVESWHAWPTDRYDFAQGTQRLEIKAASGGRREHHFSLEQVIPPNDTQVVIASVLLERAAGGPSLENMISRVRDCVSHVPQLLVRVDQVCAETLGVGWRDAYSQSFDLQRARQSLTYFGAESIPKPDPNLPPTVSSVHFVSDLSTASALGRDAMTAFGGLLSAAVSS